MSSLASHVRHFVPGAQDKELERRVTLLKARDYSANLLGRTISRRAYNLAHDAHEIAGEFVYADAPPELLRVAAECCRHLAIASVQVERLDAEGGVQ